MKQGTIFTNAALAAVLATSMATAPALSGLADTQGATLAGVAYAAQTAQATPIESVVITSDWTATDEENQVMTSTMRHCPSKGMLLKLDYMEPYHDYCGHCSVLYAPVLDKYGIERIETCDPDSASCSSILRMKKK